MSDEKLRKAERSYLENPSDEAIVALAKEQARAGITHVADFMRFIQGHWTLEPPKKEGFYLLATRTGECCGYVLAPYVYQDQETKNWIAVRGNYSRDVYEAWGGYWWSEPLPDMPRAPDISTDTEE